MASREEAPSDASLLVVAGIHNKRSLGMEAVNGWLDADPEHTVLATVRGDDGYEFVEAESAKRDGRISLVRIDWVKSYAASTLNRKLNELAGDTRTVKGAVHSVAGADNSNFELPAHEIDPSVYDTAFQSTASSLVRLVQGARTHMVERAGVASYGFGVPGRSMEGYGGALTVAKAALSQLVVDLGVSLGQSSPRVRVAEIYPGYIPTTSARGAIGLGPRDSIDVSRHFEEHAALTDTDAKKQREALRRMTVAFMLDPMFSETTGARLPVDGGWSVRGSLGDIKEPQTSAPSEKGE